MPVPLIPVKLRRYVRLEGTKLFAFKRGNRPHDGPIWIIELAGAQVERYDKDYKICVAVDVEDDKGGGGIGGRRWRRGGGARKRFFVLGCLNEKDFGHWLYIVLRASRSVLELHYEMERVIDMGSFATVVLGKDKITGRRVAIKLIEKKRAPGDRKVYIQRELKIVKTLDHENVVKVYDVFDSDARARIVMEYVRGGTLTELLTQKVRLNENDARLLMRGILRGVQYLHANGIVHRDLSSNNILCPSLTCPKISDFGLSAFYKTQNRVADDDDINETRARMLKSACGTTVFMAPEVLAHKPYGYQVDLWSAGVILFYLLAGELPFEGSTLTSIVQKVRKGNVKKCAQSSFWCNASDNVKDLLFQLLKMDPSERIDASQALMHPWFSVSAEHLT